METFHLWEFPFPSTALDHMFTHLTLHLQLWPLESKRTPDPSSLFMSWIPGMVDESLCVVTTEKIYAQALKGIYPIPIVGAGHQEREKHVQRSRDEEREDCLGFCPFSSSWFHSPSPKGLLLLDHMSRLSIFLIMTHFCSNWLLATH